MKSDPEVDHQNDKTSIAGDPSMMKLHFSSLKLPKCDDILCSQTPAGFAVWRKYNMQAAWQKLIFDKEFSLFSTILYIR